MRPNTANYLITGPYIEPFLTHWFDKENHFSEGMVIYNIRNWTYSKDGETWKEIEEDHL